MHKSTIKAKANFPFKAGVLHKYKYDYTNTTYTGNQHKIDINCLVHGVFSTTPQQHLQDKSGCPQCNMYNKKCTTAEFKKVVNTVNGYELISTYTNALTKVEIKHLHCGNSWYITPNKFKLGRRCPVCATTNYPKTTSEYIRELFLTTNGDLICNSPYIKSHVKLSHTHSCGHTWDITPANVLNGQSCPKCRSTSDNDILYIWNVPHTSIYKIGVTSERLGLKRLLEVHNRVTVDTLLSLVAYTPTFNASKLERYLLRTYTSTPSWDYTGDGMTEFRVLSSVDLVNILKIINVLKEPHEEIKKSV